MEQHDDADRTRAGLGLALGAYGLWGVFPLFWRLLAHVPGLEQALQRICWVTVVYLGVAAVAGKLGQVREALTDRPTRRALAGSAALVAVNWFVFIYAVETERVLHASLGYYLNPLVSVLLGLLVLGERLRPAQWVAVGLAAAGVVVMGLRADAFPWISLVLAAAFGLYGLVRKTASAEAIAGSTVEGLLLLPFCLAGVLWLEGSGQGHFLFDGRTTVLLLLTGPVTAVPMLCFAGAARRLPLTTLGFIQYLAPTMQFLVAVFLFGEAFTPAHMVAFGLIWTGVGLFAADGYLGLRGRAA